MIASQCVLVPAVQQRESAMSYIYPSFWNLPPTPHPILLSHHRAPGCLCVLVAQLGPTLCNSMDCSLPRLLCPWESPGQNPGVGCHSLLQRVIQQLPTIYLFHTWWCVYFSATLSIHPPLSCPHCVHKFILYVCVSVNALQIGSSVAFF